MLLAVKSDGKTETQVETAVGKQRILLGKAARRRIPPTELLSAHKRD
jgi:hypothetical protein